RTARGREDAVAHIGGGGVADHVAAGDRDGSRIGEGAGQAGEDGDALRVFADDGDRAAVGDVAAGSAGRHQYAGPVAAVSERTVGDPLVGRIARGGFRDADRALVVDAVSAVDGDGDRRRA